jgi:hypothetical protein
MEDVTVFSVQQDCVSRKVTTFDVPKNMPACSSPSGRCICSCAYLLCSQRRSDASPAQLDLGRADRRRQQLCVDATVLDER